MSERARGDFSQLLGLLERLDMAEVKEIVDVIRVGSDRSALPAAADDSPIGHGNPVRHHCAAGGGDMGQTTGAGGGTRGVAGTMEGRWGRIEQKDSTPLGNARGGGVTESGARGATGRGRGGGGQTAAAGRRRRGDERHRRGRVGGGKLGEKNRRSGLREEEKGAI
ncbi:hypothetical protein GUJ93_ZPchr0002g25204 [Zizania palustris]|uniref:Uncharacterized protein n=1 Tax=Zizania palustris TaxID=103762 RepID=A0A8J5SCX1_ZIZPA|nr:hypothetical protein GUJ93_ZPchr0002g25204 [Zizania palustris]